MGLLLRRLVALLLAFALLALALTSSADLTKTWILAVVYALAGLSLNLVIGYTGQLSLGHQGFLGLGALFTAYFTAEQGLPFPLPILLGMAISAAFAAALGLVALRITGLYLALITLVFGTTLENSLFQVSSLTGGGAGEKFDRPHGLVDIHSYFVFCLLLLALVGYVDHRLARSKVGRALLALREDERVAAAYAVDVTAYKVLAFTLSGAIAGLAGALFATSSQAFFGKDYDFTLALTLVIVTVVGGLGSRAGIVVSAVVFALINTQLDKHVLQAGWFAGPLSHVPVLNLVVGPNHVVFQGVLGALLLLVTLVLYPGGVGQSLAPVGRWLRGGPMRRDPLRDVGLAVVEAGSVRA